MLEPSQPLPVPLGQTAEPPPKRRRLLAKFSGVALVGFVLSATILHLGLEMGFRPWAARLIALVFAMNVTFLINGRFVFGGLTRRRFLVQWATYCANSACGNFCNYWTFVTLESTHRAVIGDPYVALAAGSVVAWAINFTGARFVVFGGGAQGLKARLARLVVSPRSRPAGPAPAEPGSSRR
ncbi:MAG: GtrA family protein [Proteobacteria bacterium]|nr:GtrA family protein [Pseudomonadota bacterium]